MNSFPFTSQDGDRKVMTSDFRELFKKYFTNGVFNGTFNVVQSTGMKVVLKKGWCNIEGCFGWSEEDIELTIDSVSQETTHNIVLRLDDNREVRTINAYVVKGNPNAVEPTRTETIYELVVARIKTNASTTTITQSMIEDTRLDTNLCGIVANTVNVLNTQTYYDQLQGALDEFLDTVQQAIDGTLAGNLQSQIDQKSKIIDGLGQLLLEAPMTPQDNLLINSDFRYGVINQKEQSSYNSVARLYGADSWYVFTNSTLEVYENYIKITLPNVLSEVGQLTDELVNRLDSLTFALKLRNNDTIYKATFENISSTMPSSGNKMSKNIYGNISVNLFSYAGKLSIFLTATTNTTIEVEFMKVEKGKFFTGMPVYNKTIELLKCQKKYVMLKDIKWALRGYNTQIFTLSLLLPIDMEKTPSVKVINTDGSFGIENITTWSNGQVIQIAFKCLNDNMFDARINRVEVDAYDY